MLLAALIARYWKKRCNETELDMDGKTKFSFIKKIKMGTYVRLFMADCKNARIQQPVVPAIHLSLSIIF